MSNHYGVWFLLQTLEPLFSENVSQFGLKALDCVVLASLVPQCLDHILIVNHVDDPVNRVWACWLDLLAQELVLLDDSLAQIEPVDDWRVYLNQNHIVGVI